MDLQNKILEDVRMAVGLAKDNTDFDTDLKMYINSALSTLNQNGVGSIINVDDTKTWLDFQDPLQVEGNKYFQMVPLYVSLSTRILFDPPPPSSVEYHSRTIDQLLWRLKVAYEDYLPIETPPVLD